MQHIKRLAILACVAILAAPVAAQISSPWAFTQDVAKVEGSQQAMTFFAAESLDLSLVSRRNGRALDLSDPGLRFLWEITAQSNAATTWAVSTGAVVTATNGATRFAMTPTQANLPPGTYNGYVRAMWTNASLSSNVVLHFQSLTVKQSADSALYAPVDPITQAFGLTGVVVNSGGSVTQSGRRVFLAMTGAIASVSTAGSRLTVTNGSGPNVLLNFDAIGLATGAPIYSVSGLATGVPIYAESDPVWVAASNATAQAIATAQATGVAAMASALLALTNIQESGSGNAITGSAVIGRSGVLYRGSIAGGSGVQYQDAQGFTNSGGVVIGSGIARAGSFAGGDSSVATGTEAFAFGSFAKAYGNGAIAIGSLGPNAWADGAIALGLGPDAYSYGSVAIGENSEARGVNAFALGGLATNVRAYSIGYAANAGHEDSFAFGDAATTTSGQFAAWFSNGYAFAGGAMVGNGAGITNVNAATLGGYAASAFSTGTPVYAESDPLAVTSAYIHATTGTGAVSKVGKQLVLTMPASGLSGVIASNGLNATLAAGVLGVGVQSGAFLTGGVVSVSATGPVSGAITFAGSGVTQTGSIFNFSATGVGGSGTLTSVVRGAGSSTRLTVTNGGGPQVTLNLDVGGLATGTPLYAYAWAENVATTNADMADFGLGNVAYLALYAHTNAVPYGSIYQTNGVLMYKDPGGTRETVWTSDNLNPVTVPSVQTNYWRIVTPPASAGAFGVWGYLSYDQTNIYIYHAASSRWLRVSGTLAW